MQATTIRTLPWCRMARRSLTRSPPDATSPHAGARHASCRMGSHGPSRSRSTGCDVLPVLRSALSDRPMVKRPRPWALQRPQTPASRRTPIEVCHTAPPYARVSPPGRPRWTLCTTGRPLQRRRPAAASRSGKYAECPGDGEGADRDSAQFSGGVVPRSMAPCKSAGRQHGREPGC
jgi:hypothetical protein